MQPDLYTTRTTRGQRRILPIPRVGLQILNAIEPLQQPHSREARRRERKLLAQANPRSAIERQIFPPDLAPRPALRSELVGVFSPKVLGAMHDVDAVGDFLALFDEYRALAVRPAASRQRRVFECRAAVDGDHGVEAESFAEDVLQVLAALELGEGHVAGRAEGSKLFDDDAAQLLEDGGVADEEEEEPAEE